jgi:hypothetical protein
MDSERFHHFSFPVISRTTGQPGRPERLQHGGDGPAAGRRRLSPGVQEGGARGARAARPARQAGRGRTPGAARRERGARPGAAASQPDCGPGAQGGPREARQAGQAGTARPARQLSCTGLL